jgi:uncharacterized protein YtpQ (UPF0354 family)
MKFILLNIMVMFGLNVFGQNRKVEKTFRESQHLIFPIVKAQLENEFSIMKLNNDDEPLYRKISGDLLCFYGIDRGSHFELLLRKQIPKNMNIEEIEKIALGNMIKIINNELQVQQTAFGAIGLTCGGTHEAALMLLPEVWEIMKEKIGDMIAFAVPSKDLFICVNAMDDVQVNELKRLIEQVHNGGEFLLSKKIYKYQNDKIAVLIH